MRELLASQLDLTWRFAQECVLDTLVPEDLHWKPPAVHGLVCTVRQRDGVWVADWPDESRRPLPQVTVAWLLWHIEWWWTDTIARVDQRPSVPPAEHHWSGGTHGIIAAKERWSRLLTADDLDAEVDWLLPAPVPLWRVAGWVPIELMKNLAEIQQLMIQRSHESS